MGNVTQTAEKRVLIVDDSKFVRTTFNRILRSSFVVLEAVDGEAAWKTLQEDSSIVMVFSDLDMPKLDGFGLLRLIRGAKDERIRKLPVIVISGSQDQGANSRARQAGANDFISKSAEAPDVLSRIDEMLRSVKPNPRPEPAAPQLAPAQATATQEIATIKAAAQQPAVATHDPLTGTLTSANLLGEARRQFSHARRHGGQLSIMAFRVDSYAEAARDAGKEVSDQVLARIAKMIQGMLRTEDSFGRVAEATFMVVSAGAGAAQITGFARRLHSQLESAQVRHNSRVLKIRSECKPREADPRTRLWANPRRPRRRRLSPLRRPRSRLRRQSRWLRCRRTMSAAPSRCCKKPIRSTSTTQAKPFCEAFSTRS